MNKLLLAAAVSSALFALPASAQLYLGAGGGVTKTDTNETAWKMYGGYQFNRTWGLELGYTDLGRYRGSDIQALSLAATATMPLNERWSLLGKVGATSNHAEFAGASNHSALLLGIGAGYNLTKSVGFRLEYEDFGRLSSSSVGGDSNGRDLTLSVKYTFN